MECPNCGADDMLFYPGETYEYILKDGSGTSTHTEPDMYSCPECGHDEIEPS
jgi:predicted RNA-binding Zn-ribbon protein involved in translation (DUF1610 family)